MDCISDVHLEFGTDPPILNPTSDCLALAGDIGCIDTWNQRRKLSHFLRYCGALYKRVYYVPGNHELYSTTGVPYDFILNELDNMCKEITNENQHEIYFMNRKVVQDPYMDTNVIGCTLWSKISIEQEYEIERSINDYRYIFTTAGCRLTVEDQNEWHRKDVDFLNNLDIWKHPKYSIIITHHSPVIHSRDNFWTAFQTNLEHLIKYPIEQWSWGHTHRPYAGYIRDVYVMSNPHLKN